MRLLRYVLLPLLLLQPVTAFAHWPHRIYGERNTWIGMVSPVNFDLDNDGTKELVITTQGNPEGHLSTLYILDAAGNMRSQTNADSYFGARTFPSLADIDNDGATEIVMVCDSLLIYDAQGNLERSIDTYFYLSDDLYAAPVLADVNNDNSIEVIYGGWHLDGSRLVVLDNNGNDVPGFPVMLEPYQGSETNTPAVGNLDDDAEWEIVALSHRNETNSDTTHVGAYNVDGSLLWWRKVFAISRSDPVIGDVNADGSNEVVFTSEDGVHVLAANGATLLNLPLGQGMAHSNIALADLDGDGDLEIVFGYDMFLYAMHHDGAVIFRYQSDWLTHHPPVIGDIDSDGSPDILFNSDDEIYALNAGGVLMEGFPKRMDLIAYSAPSIDDLDGDGMVDVISSANWIEPSVDVGIIYVWELNGLYEEAAVPWQMFQHDPQHTGYYENGSAAGVSDGSDVIGEAGGLAAVPNPSVGEVRMTYRLRRATAVSIEVFNAAGALVRRLGLGQRSAGWQAIEWDGRDDRGEKLAAGVYLTRVVTGEGIRTGRVVIVR